MPATLRMRRISSLERGAAGTAIGFVEEVDGLEMPALRDELTRLHDLRAFSGRLGNRRTAVPGLPSAENHSRHTPQ